MSHARKAKVRSSRGQPARWLWRLVRVWKRWQSLREEARRKKAANDLLWDYWIAKDAFERGDITAEQFFYDERFFPGWKDAIEKKKTQRE